ncbi:flippase activity-associated protein Agl23 [Methanospirillum stamsii]|uniref:TIGR03663 family protein n=1 Tax=Methanospirillum stamsii TaxID=1277351 RepID=A0A2V2MWW4_9EURY|nr:flippase activity-associated protein Agl23 [Methanospirillum stamsii]PWR70755.1 TIGR03663 family protein [Methanospirillum stamsii]
MNILKFREKIANFSIEKIITIIFLIGLILRVLLPNLKLLHHDEAIHAWFSYELVTKGVYQYDPMYHGPFLYYLTAGIFKFCGDSDLVVRLLPAVFGSAIILLIYGIYKTGWLSRNQTIWSAIFFAISPDMVYFSRFLRHDIFQLFFTVLLLLSIIAYIEFKKPGWAILAGFSAACGMCLKEEMPVAIFIFGAFFILLLIKNLIILPRSWRWDILGAVIVAGFTGFLFYSSFFTHPEMFWEAPVKAIEHWTSMHDQCRLCGPPYWYIAMFILYELPLFALAVFGVWEWGYKNGGISSIFHPHEEIPSHTGNTKQHYLMALITVWALCTIVFYGYIGEKVPWLLIHQLFPVLILASYAMTGKKVIAGIITALFLIGMTLHVCFTPVDINEPIVQVQNSEDMREVMKLIDAADSVVVTSDSYWPLPWYYRGTKWNKIQFYGKKVDPVIWAGKDPDVIIAHDIDSYSSLAGFEKREYHLSYWFSWYDNQNRPLQWFFLRDGEMGTVNLDVFVREK